MDMKERITYFLPPDRYKIGMPIDQKTKGVQNMDIAALSMAMSQVSVAQSASLQVMSMSKDMAEQQGQQLTEMLKSVPAPHPNLGGSLDISV